MAHHNCFAQKEFESVYTEFDDHDNRKILKDYAVCKCIELYVKSEDWKIDPSLSLLSVTDLGYNYKWQAYSFVDSVLKKFIEDMPGPEGTYYNHKGMLLHCIMFYNSKYLNDVVTGADKYLIKNKSTERNSH